MVSELTDEALEELERLVSKEQWHPYFTVHGDPFVVTDLHRPAFTKICTVNPDSAEDYGRDNTFSIACLHNFAPSLLAEVRRLRREVADLRERMDGKTVAYPAGYEEALKVVEAAQAFMVSLLYTSRIRLSTMGGMEQEGYDRLTDALLEYNKMALTPITTAEATGGQAAVNDIDLEVEL